MFLYINLITGLTAQTLSHFPLNHAHYPIFPLPLVLEPFDSLRLRSVQVAQDKPVEGLTPGLFQEARAVRRTSVWGGESRGGRRGYLIPYC